MLKQVMGLGVTVKLKLQSSNKADKPNSLIFKNKDSFPSSFIWQVTIYSKDAKCLSAKL